MPDLAWLNGRFMPLRKATVPVMDRAFLFGDGIYEVIRTHGGRPFLLDAHLRRLQNSARMLEMPCPSNALLRRVIARGLRRAGCPETVIYLQVTRGIQYPRAHVPAGPMRPNVLAAFWRLKDRNPADFERGLACITVEDFRWGRCDIKSVNLLANCMGKMEAKRRGATEVIFVKDGLLVEGGSSAVFVVTRGHLRVPRLGPNILPSLTRELVLGVAREVKVRVRAGPVTVREMMAAGEVFLASTTAEGVPVVRIDGCRIGDGRPGPVSRAIRAGIVARTSRR